MKKVKRYLLLFSVLACVLALTACGKKSKDVKPTFDYDGGQLGNYITANTEAMAAMSNKEINKTIEQYSDKKDDEISTTIKEGLEQFKNARSDSKDFEEFYQNKNKETKYKISTTKDEVTVKVTAKFKKRDVKVAYTFGLVDDNLNVTSIMYEPQFSLGEKMEKAALNTVMGLSTVALVLIFLSILISLFKYVSILQNAIVKIVTTIKNAFAKIIGKKD